MTRGRVRRAGLYAAILVGTLAAAEIALRIWDWQPRLKPDAVGDGLGLTRYYHSPSGVGDLVPDQDGHWVVWFHRPYHVQTNSLGLRNVEEPTASAVRIVALGDSQTFGPYLANEDTWPAWLETLLRKARGRSDTVQVFNAGIAGYTIADQLAQLRDKILPFAPDLVVLGVFENDVQDLRKETNGVVQRPADPRSSQVATALKVLARSSAIVAFAERASLSIDLAGLGRRLGQGETGPQTGRAAGDDFERLSTRYAELFREAAGLLRAQGVAFAVAFLPAPDMAAGNARSDAEALVRKLAAETGTPYLDVTPAHAAVDDVMSRSYLMAWNARTRSFEGNGHFSREGNYVTGRAIADWLEAQGLVVRRAPR